MKFGATEIFGRERSLIEAGLLSWDIVDINHIRGVCPEANCPCILK